MMVKMLSTAGLLLSLLAYGPFFWPVCLATSPLLPPKTAPDENAGAKSGEIFGDTNAGRAGRSFVSDPVLLWPKQDERVIVPYVLDPSFSEDAKATIRAAAAHFTPRTCVIFVEEDIGDVTGSFLNILNSGKCSAPIGRAGNGALPVNLNATLCLNGQGTAMHMLAHTLGFYHEHQRPDRNSFININYDNVCPGKENEFEIVANAQTFGVTYDFGSITHFNKLAFSKCDPDVCPEEAGNCASADEKPTMSVKNKEGMDNLLGQRETLSILDRAKIRNGYGCTRRTFAGGSSGDDDNGEDDDDDGPMAFGCLHGDNVISSLNHGQNEATIPLRDASLGDKLLGMDTAGNLVYSRLFMHFHGAFQGIFPYVNVITDSGRKLMLTRRHQIFIIVQGEKVPVMAREVSVGDMVMTRTEVETVTSVTVTELSDARAPLTITGNLLLDGVLASCYAENGDYHADHWGMAPVRLVHKLVERIATSRMPVTLQNIYINALLMIAKFGEIL